MTDHAREAAERIYGAQCHLHPREMWGTHIDAMEVDIAAAIEAATHDLRSWAGLLSILDELYPADIPGLSSPEGGPGPHLVWALREIERLKAQVAELRACAMECELCGRGTDDKPHVICGECQSECSQPRKQEPARPTPSRRT